MKSGITSLLLAALVSTPLASVEPRITVYVMDNGVREDHRAFEGIPIESVDFLKSKEPSTEDENIESESIEPFGDHATLLAGIVVERAPQVSLVSVRSLNEKGEGSWSSFVKGVHWIHNHHPSGQPAVANLSLGGVSSNPRIRKLVTKAIDQLVAAGVVVVVAAANDAIDETERIPSTLESVISVGAVSMFGARLDSSNFGSCVDVYAPGKDFEGPGSLSRIHRIRDSGTSVAAAVVTGRVAAHLGSQPHAAPGDVKAWVLQHSVPGRVKTFPAPMLPEPFYLKTKHDNNRHQARAIFKFLLG